MVEVNKDKQKCDKQCVGHYATLKGYKDLLSMQDSKGKVLLYVC